MDYVIAIPSYKRANKQLTLDYLERIGWNKELTMMSVQTEEDYRDYQNAGIDKRVGKLIYRQGDNLSDNLNTLLEANPVGSKILFLDDDCYSIQKLENGKLKDLETVKEIDDLVEYGFNLAEKHKTIVWGGYPCPNAFFMRDAYRDRFIVVSAMIGIINTELRFDRTFPTKMDFEFCCQVIRKYGACIRLDNYTAKSQSHSKGGCFEFWQDEKEVVDTANRLVKKYPDLIKSNPARVGEVKMAEKKYEGFVQESLF